MSAHEYSESICVNKFDMLLSNVRDKHRGLRRFVAIIQSRTQSPQAPRSAEEPVDSWVRDWTSTGTCFLDCNSILSVPNPLGKFTWNMIPHYKYISQPFPSICTCPIPSHFPDWYGLIWKIMHRLFSNYVRPNL